MAIYDNDGTTSYEIGMLYDNDGTTSYQIGTVYDNDGTTSSLIYNANLEFILSASNWTTDRSDSTITGNSDGSVTLVAYPGTTTTTFTYNTQPSISGYSYFVMVVSAINSEYQSGLILSLTPSSGSGYTGSTITSANTFRIPLSGMSGTLKIQLYEDWGAGMTISKMYLE